MSWFNRIFIRNKLMFIFLVGILGFVISLVFNYFVNFDISSWFELVCDQYYLILELVNIVLVVLDVMVEMFNFVVSVGEQDMVVVVDEIVAKMCNLLDKIYSFEFSCKVEVEKLCVDFDSYYFVVCGFFQGMIFGDIDFLKLNECVFEMIECQRVVKQEL